MWEIHIPWVWRHVGTLGHETHIAEVASINHLPVLLFFDPIKLAGTALINQIKQARKCRTQTDTATTAMTDVKNPLRLIKQLCFIIKI